MRTGHQQETISLKSLNPLQPIAMFFKFTFSAVSFRVAKAAYCTQYSYHQKLICIFNFTLSKLYFSSVDSNKINVFRKRQNNLEYQPVQ